VWTKKQKGPADFIPYFSAQIDGGPDAPTQAGDRDPDVIQARILGFFPGMKVTPVPSHEQV
jgi:hypothetical protein